MPNQSIDDTQRYSINQSRNNNHNDRNHGLYTNFNHFDSPKICFSSANTNIENRYRDRNNRGNIMKRRGNYRGRGGYFRGRINNRGGRGGYFRGRHINRGGRGGNGRNNFNSRENIYY